MTCIPTLFMNGFFLLCIGNRTITCTFWMKVFFPLKITVRGKENSIHLYFLLNTETDTGRTSFEVFESTEL